MVLPNPVLTKRTVLLAAIEGTYNVDANPTNVDAILVSEPMFSIDPNLLERDYARNDLSPLNPRVGRTLAKMSFTCEMKSNGLTNTGIADNASKLGRLLRGCAFSETGLLAEGCVGEVVPDDADTGPDVVWDGAANSNTYVRRVYYTLEVTTGGASGTAKVKITPDSVAVANGETEQTDVTITSATPLALKSGTTVTPTWTGNLVVGDKYRVAVSPPGVQYLPVSDSFESLTLYMYKDGKLHKITGAMGTVSGSADAGAYGTFKFEFTGQYVPDTDAALPALTRLNLEQLSPPIFANAELRLEAFAAVINSMSFDMQNAINPRSDANSSDGYAGVRMTGRQPKMGLDPEATLVATYDFFGKLKASQGVLYRSRIGLVPGNQVFMFAPSASYTGITYQDRDGIRVYGLDMELGRVNGNDEIELLFA